MNSTFKKPSAWLPIALSLAMLTVMAILFASHGVPTPDQNKDEGVSAHLFQIWLVLEVIMIPIFVIKWLPQAPRQVLIIFAIQAFLIFATCFPVFYFKL